VQVQVQPPESLFHKRFLDLPLEDLARTRQNLVEAFGISKHYVKRTSLDGPCLGFENAYKDSLVMSGKSVGALDNTKHRNYVAEVQISDQGSIDSLAELVARAFDGKVVESFEGENSADVKNLIAELLQKEEFVKMISTLDTVETEAEAVLESELPPPPPSAAASAEKEEEVDKNEPKSFESSSNDKDEGDGDGGIRYVIDDDSEYTGNVHKELEQARNDLIDALPKEYQDAMEELVEELGQSQAQTLGEGEGDGEEYQSVFMEALAEMNGAERHRLYTSQGFDADAIEILEEMLKGSRDPLQLQRQFERQKEALLQQVHKMQRIRGADELKKDLERSKAQLKEMFPNLFRDEQPPAAAAADEE
jgi:hypothetical protein